MDINFLSIILTSSRNEFTSYQQNELQTAGESLQIRPVLLSRKQSAGNGTNFHCRRGIQVSYKVDEVVMVRWQDEKRLVPAKIMQMDGMYLLIFLA